MSDRSSPLPPVLDMQGQQNISLMVALRIRPLTQDEKAKGASQVAYRIDDRMVVLMDPGDNMDDVLRQKRSREKRFVFDVAFGPETSQEEVYERTTKQLIDNVVNGYNATVFAYGATGAGKTFTMIGTESNHGVMARALNDLFLKIQQDHEHSSYTVKMSYLEIYNEMIRDLLQPSSGYLDVREDSKGGIQVAGLTEIGTTSSQDIMRLLMEGNKRRTQEPTAANKTSSRSHAIVQVTVTQRSRVRNVKSANHVGRLFLIDLAGSERASHTQNTGQRLKEGAHINRSLLALGNVINTLAEKGARFVNYRDSKLTRLLKDSLGGNSRTIMIANISPSAAQFEESRNTLIYADRAKNISNKVIRNNQDVTYHVTQYQSIISELRKEIGRLKAKIDEQNGLPAPSGLTRSESALSFLRHKQSLAGSDTSTNVTGSYATTDQLPPIDDYQHHPHKRSAATQPLSTDFYRLKDEMADNFRSQMQLRQKLLGLNEAAFDQALKLSDKHREFAEVKDDSQLGPKVRREVELLEKKLKDMDHKRAEIEWDLSVSQKKGKKMEESLPQKVTVDEEKEMLNYFTRLHAAEVEKIALQSDAMILQRRLHRQESALRRLRDYRQVADQVISGQHDLIKVSQVEYPQRLRAAVDDYQTKRKSAEVLLEPLDTRASIMGKISWNRTNLDRENSMREGRMLNKTLNASELQSLKRMTAMLDRERSNVSEPSYVIRRPGSAGSLPAVDTAARKLHDDSTPLPRPRKNQNTRRDSDLSLMDIRSVAKYRRPTYGPSAAAGVSWKNPVAVAFPPGTPESTLSIASPASSTTSTDPPPPVRVLQQVPRKPARPLVPIGVPAGPVRTSRNAQKRSSRSKRKTRSSGGSRRNSASPVQNPSHAGPQAGHSGGNNPNPRKQSNPNRRIRSPTQPKLPVVR